MSLDSLGLTEFEELVYRAMLRQEEPAGDRYAVRAAVDRLTDLELIRAEADGRFSAVPAEVGITRLIRRRMQETNAELRRISGAWETVHALAAEGRQPGGHDDFERIEGAKQVDERVWALALDAREVLTIHHKERKVQTNRLPRYVERLGDGVQWRTILPRGQVSDPDVLAYCMQLHRAGDRHRLTEQDVQQMIIVDRQVAFVPIVPNAHRSGALMIRQPGAVATLVDLFERVWGHATDLEPGEQEPLSQRERQVLDLLATAVKDEISARQMGVSLRTYRRYVAELLARLGAANRFQAAIVAKQRGWI
ncbi:DNA-binding NarL/FixJ family response regulator [Kibdelosporangium banguiense]|uniref:DNA-binding NarL/FixJ family response regulator n=1 Tax=Kibdelosporangium banguiense TaxID=1365924 RepID=A0ABS4TQX9_9PSEU|nr:LuxR C-terminal-related transcriptional regulator [Kibdelosporangium banguiense]MBP2326823.1 DNA-binding NarL/FixJ family response regulator [Kibdelosporangium banguiense]